LALTLPDFAAVQVALTTSTRITSAAILSSYQIAPQWLATGQLGYVGIEYVGSSRADNSWLLVARLRYEIWRDMLLTWEYRYRSVLSNVTFASVKSNFVLMSATYKF
jgi:hypothetical protein